MIDHIVNRLCNCPDFDIYSVLQTGRVSETPSHRVVINEVVKEIILNEATLAEDVYSVAAQIMYWGRLAARAQRVYEITERQYRIWRDGKRLLYLEKTDDPKWKKPTKDETEWKYRTEPEYENFQRKIEETLETYNACKAIYDAFKAKKDVITHAITRFRDDSQSRLVF